VPEQRYDLGASFHVLTRAMIEMELPVLADHGIEMWDYAILSALERSAAPTQNDLALAVGRDKTRLIGNLDRLVERGLVERNPDPADRRNRVVTLTAEGRALVAGCRNAIRALERGFLSGLSAAERKNFLATLERLADGVRAKQT